MANRTSFTSGNTKRYPIVITHGKRVTHIGFSTATCSPKVLWPVAGSSKEPALLKVTYRSGVVARAIESGISIRDWRCFRYVRSDVSINKATTSRLANIPVQTVDKFVNVVPNIGTRSARICPSNCIGVVRHG